MAFHFFFFLCFFFRLLAHRKLFVLKFILLVLLLLLLSAFACYAHKRAVNTDYFYQQLPNGVLQYTMQLYDRIFLFPPPPPSKPICNGQCSIIADQINAIAANGNNIKTGRINRNVILIVHFNVFIE